MDAQLFRGSRYIRSAPVLGSLPGNGNLTLGSASPRSRMNG